MRGLAVLPAAIAMSASAMATEPIHLYAAGSLRGALSEAIKAFEAGAGLKVRVRFRPSGLLKNAIAKGAKADVFASANMKHPQALANSGKSGPVKMFARNKLCALARPGLAVTPDNVLARMLDPTIKLGTSTPKSDPSGDYAWQMFKKAEAVQAGAYAILDKKALKLTGAKDSAAPPAGRIVYGWHVAEGRADIFVTYCTNAVAAQKQNAGQQIVSLPSALAVGADYGLTVMSNAAPAAERLADYILSAEGQAVLAKFGFAPPN
jgi:molybdate transport system substrate-binding protein